MIESVLPTMVDGIDELMLERAREGGDLTSCQCDVEYIRASHPGLYGTNVFRCNSHRATTSSKVHRPHGPYSELHHGTQREIIHNIGRITI